MQISTPVQHYQATQPIVLTQAAVAQYEKLLAKAPEAIGVRVLIKKTGCSGYAYAVELVEAAAPGDQSFPINATHALYVDPESLRLIAGTEIDYVQESLNQKKFVYRNPKQTGECGCGESFTVD